LGQFVVLSPPPALVHEATSHRYDRPWITLCVVLVPVTSGIPISAFVVRSRSPTLYAPAPLTAFHTSVTDVPVTVAPSAGDTCVGVAGAAVATSAQKLTAVTSRATTLPRTQ
jgi:hypothetical protein